MLKYQIFIHVNMQKSYTKVHYIIPIIVKMTEHILFNCKSNLCGKTFQMQEMFIVQGHSESSIRVEQSVNITHGIAITR